VDRETYWRLVEKARPANNDADKHYEKMVALLAKQEPAEILAWERIFSEYYNRAYRADLWSAIYEIDGGCSNDAFLDFRAWLVMQGEDVVETVLESPEYLGEITLEEGVMSGEAFNYVAGYAYERRTGEEGLPQTDGPRKPLKLKGRHLRTQRAFKRKFPMLWRLLHDAPDIDPGWLKWQGGTVKKLATAIHKERRWAALPVLADTLEEAGCRDPFVLDHLRAGRRHARSCWVTNFVLGKP
jgi:hypothetical protein